MDEQQGAEIDVSNLLDHDIELPEQFDGLPVFAVGGWVRDVIRGVEPSDLDLMVAEVSPAEMRERGFREIDSPNNETFGVFQDDLGREVAIAREEVSSADGDNPHTAFDVEPIDPSVPASEAVERDLKRRDIRFNSMAFDLRWGSLHDPHDGLADLEKGVVRAVDATSFVEDPLRVLRAARFASRLQFAVDDTTKGLMRDAAGSLDDLPQERLRMELEKALVQSPEPGRFFEVLDDIAALPHSFPEVGVLKNVPAGPEEFHEEGSTFDHTMLVLDEMARRRPRDEIAMLMALAHDFGKALTPEEEWPHHPKHEVRGIEVAESFAERLSMSNEQERAMVEAARWHGHFHDIDDLRESTVIDIWTEIRNRERMLDLAMADAIGRRPRRAVSRGDIVRRLAAAKQAVEEWDGQRLIDDGFDPDEMGGEEFGTLLRQRRVERMRAIEQ